MTPQAFKASIETRIRQQATAEGRPIARVRSLLVMERFLARTVAVAPDLFVLKGGIALELRLERARTTRDIDFRVMGNPAELDVVLRKVEAFRPDPEDHLRFRIEPNRTNPTIEGDGVPYDGFRFTVTGELAGKTYGDPFGLDVAYGDAIIGRPDTLTGSGFFEKYGIPALEVAAYPLASHLAEKLHAYTMPRERPNSRVKDLLDIAMLSTCEGLRAQELRDGFGLTFECRNTHAVPVDLPDPPPTWAVMYVPLRTADRLPWADINEVLKVARDFLNPVLAGAEGTWNPVERTWG